MSKGVSGGDDAHYRAAFHQLVGSESELSGEDAVGFFSKSGLNTDDLRDIWDMCDKRGVGALSVQEFLLAMKLIKAAQDGKEVTEENAKKVKGLCTLNGWKWEDVKTTTAATSTPLTSSQWDVSSEEKTKFDNVYDRLELEEDGTLSGDVARDVLLHSGLPPPVLGKIWECADLDKDGKLDRDEFAVAMHLVYKCLAGENVPSTIPASLVPPSKRSEAAGLGKNEEKEEVVNEPLLLHKGMTKDNKTKWVVTSKGRKMYQQFFAGADKDKDGLVSGDDVRSIFLTSKLPKAELAKLWDLVDIFDTGTLNAELFYLAMHLVSERVKGVKLPDVLSDNMVPPSCRDSALTSPPICSKEEQHSSKKQSKKAAKATTKKPTTSTSNTSDDTVEVKVTTTQEKDKQPMANTELVKKEETASNPEEEEKEKEKKHETTEENDDNHEETRNDTVSSSTNSNSISSVNRSREKDVEAADDEIKHLKQSLDAQQLTNTQLKTRVDKTDELLVEKKNEIVELKRRLEALRVEESSLRQMLKNGKAQVKDLIHELKKTTAAVNKVGETNGRLQDSNRRVANALRDFSDAPNAMRQQRGQTSFNRRNSNGKHSHKKQQNQRQRNSKSMRVRGSGNQRPQSLVADPFAVQSNDPFAVQSNDPFAVQSNDPWGK
eukprot:m.82779 g.82779  ORF g.82779 m.82779 type:complete len:660 (-) comp12101_c0_seq2:77-2056(-)